MMEHLAGLALVPPPQRFDLHSQFFQCRPGLIDLDLGAAVSQEVRQLVIKQDLHQAVSDFPRILTGSSQLGKLKGKPTQLSAPSRN